VVRVDLDDRAELLAAAPDVYYVTDHYLGYSAVLVRLSRITPDVLRDLLGMAGATGRAELLASCLCLVP
jgi:hypothetical protein